MNSRVSSPFICLCFFLFTASATAFNITKILSQSGNFGSFNDLLTKTQLASTINSRGSITVLALDDGAVGSLSGKPDALVKNILELHVVLDYFDTQKLQKLSNKTALLTTLFQTSGLANSQLGFLNVTITSNGVEFGSAVKGSPLDSKLVKSVASQPYNISVLQISSPVIPQGIDGVKSNHTAASPSATPAGAPKKSPTKAPSASPKKAPSPKSAKSPATSATPASSPTADGPDADAADAPSPSSNKKSSGARVSVGMFVSVVTLSLASWIAF